jgi:hypothetical protein
MYHALAFFFGFFIFPTWRNDVEFCGRHLPVTFKKIEIPNNQIFLEMIKK